MNTLSAIFLAVTIQNHLPPKLLSSLCWVESKHDIHAIHKDDGTEDSLGICQLHLSTAREMGYKGTRQQLMQPTTNIRYAAKYLKFQLRRYNNNIAKAVIAYNRGNSRGLTTSKYQTKVFKQWGKVNDKIQGRRHR